MTITKNRYSQYGWAALYVVVADAIYPWVAQSWHPIFPDLLIRVWLIAVAIALPLKGFIHPVLRNVILASVFLGSACFTLFSGSFWPTERLSILNYVPLLQGMSGIAIRPLLAFAYLVLAVSLAISPTKVRQAVIRCPQLAAIVLLAMAFGSLSIGERYTGDQVSFILLIASMMCLTKPRDI